MLGFMLAVTAGAPSATRAAFVRNACAVISAPIIGCEIYARLRPKWSEASLPSLSAPTGVTTLVIVLPGAGGPDANSNRVAEALSCRECTVVEYDWKAFCGDTLRAPRNAMRVGQHLGLELAKIPTLQRVHLVGISVGAFAANAAVDTFHVKAAAPCRTQLTLLDPFTARGVAGLARQSTAFGVSEFGRNADEAVCVLNTDDPVPSTNVPLRFCRNVDVTDAVARERFQLLVGDSYHSWPVGWFGLNGGRLPRDVGSLKRGQVLRVS